jgi:hypothetical protein
MDSAMSVRKLQSIVGNSDTISVESIARDSWILSLHSNLTGVGVGVIGCIDPSTFGTTTLFELASGTTDATALSAATWDYGNVMEPAPNAFGQSGRVVYATAKLRYTGAPLNAKGGAYIYVGNSLFQESNTVAVAVTVLKSNVRTRYVSASELLRGVDIHLRPCGDNAVLYQRAVAKVKPTLADDTVETPNDYSVTTSFEKAWIVYTGGTASDSLQVSVRVGFEIMPLTTFASIATPARKAPVHHNPLPGHISSQYGRAALTRERQYVTM